MKDINLYKDIILKFEEESKIKEKNIEEEYSESINSFCNDLYPIIFNSKLKSIIKFDIDTNINDDDKIKIVEDNYLLYRRFTYITKQQKFILEFNSLNLDRIFKNYMFYKDTFIYDISNEFNKRYKNIKIQIYGFDIYEEREYDKLNEAIPNLYRYSFILNYLSTDDEYMKLEKERNLEKEWKKKHPILSSFLNYHFK